MSSRPEHDKVRAVKDRSQEIGNFIEWLQENNMQICSREEVFPEHHQWFPTHKSIETLLAEYFEIDLDKLEEEKRAMLAELRGENPTPREIVDEVINMITESCTCDADPFHPIQPPCPVHG